MKPREPRLIFALPAWLKLQLLCHAGDTEIGAFALTSPDDPFYVEDVIALKQYCTSTSVEFDDEAVACYFDEQVDQGRKPENFFRIWLHTHPGESPTPSSIDEETFTRVFGTCDWAVMFILARGGAVYCRLRISSNSDTAKGFQLEKQIPVCVEYSALLQGEFTLPTEKWRLEHAVNVRTQPEFWPVHEDLFGLDDFAACEAWMDRESADLLDAELRGSGGGRCFMMRHERFSTIIPADALSRMSCTVIGVGAIGRQVALQLAAMGVGQVQIIDHDTVEPANLGTQGYFEVDLGTPKVLATAAMMAQINPRVKVEPVHGRYTRRMAVHSAIFCCVDSIDTRKVIWNALKDRAHLFIDGRMSAEVLRVLSVCDFVSRGSYPETFFTRERAVPEPCTARSTIYCASIAAGIMVGQFTKWMRGMPTDFDVVFNLLGAELTANAA